MRYMATIYISDVMDSIAATLELQGWSDQLGPPETVYEHTGVWRGVGETGRQEWLQRALMLLLQDMSTAPEESRSGAAPMGGPHTISGSGDRTI